MTLDGNMENILNVLMWFRIGLFFIVILCAFICTVAGTCLAWKQAVHLMKEKKSAPAQMADITADSIKLKISIAIALVIIGFTAGIAVLNSPIRLELSVNRSGYGIGSLPFGLALVSSAHAQTMPDKDRAILLDFCKFTVDRLSYSIVIRGADGGLALSRERLLRSLNKAEITDEDKAGALAAAIGEDLLKDPSLRRHTRYVIVQEALPGKDVRDACKAHMLDAGAPHNPVTREIVRLLREGE